MNFEWIQSQLINYRQPSKVAPIAPRFPPSSAPFFIDKAVGNNQFAFSQGARIFYSGQASFKPELLAHDCETPCLRADLGHETVAFYGMPYALSGYTEFSQTPFYLCDNHNLVLEIWQYYADLKLPVVHVDQHRDDATFGGDLQHWREESRVCDYLDAAVRLGWIAPDWISYTESADLAQPWPTGPYILNIDLDFFAPEMTIIPLWQRLELISQLFPQAVLVTFATSPGFIEPARAIQLFELFRQNL